MKKPEKKKSRFDATLKRDCLSKRLSFNIGTFYLKRDFTENSTTSSQLLSLSLSLSLFSYSISLFHPQMFKVSLFLSKFSYFLLGLFLSLCFLWPLDLSTHIQVAFELSVSLCMFICLSLLMSTDVSNFCVKVTQVTLCMKMLSLDAIPVDVGICLSANLPNSHKLQDCSIFQFQEMSFLLSYSHSLSFSLSNTVPSSLFVYFLPLSLSMFLHPCVSLCFFLSLSPSFFPYICWVSLKSPFLSFLSIPSCLSHNRSHSLTHNLFLGNLRTSLMKGLEKGHRNFFSNQCQ